MKNGSEKKTLSGFFNALNGLKAALQIEKNFIFHGFATVMVIIFAVVFETSVTENFILILTVGMVIFAEMVNTAIERVVDLICHEVMKNRLKMDEYNEIAKTAKDISAAAVLVTAVMSVIIAAVIFLPKIINIIIT